MSHFALTVDPDPQRREAFVSAALQALSRLPDMEVKSIKHGSLAVVWSQGKNTPLSVESSPRGLALLMGQALTKTGETLKAARLLDLWVARQQDLDTLDGYFLGIAFDADGALSVLSDPLGLFPVYYSVKGEVLIVGSSPGCCVLHPTCPALLDPHGLAALLLTNALLNGRTLIKGVTHLSFGHCLERFQEGGVREREIFRLTPEATWTSLSYEKTLEEMEAMMRASLHRYRPDEPAALLLSGGLDSRLSAAFLKAEDIPFKPLTWGHPHDFEIRLATAITDALGLPLATSSSELPEALFVEATRQTAQWCGIPGCSAGAQDENGPEGLSSLAPRFWSGLIFDVTLGAVIPRPPNKPEQPPEAVMDHFFKSVNQWGMHPERLKPLMRPCLPEADIDALVHEWKATFNPSDYSDHQKSFAFTLQIRARYHLGAVIHQLSHQAWPLLPFLERSQVQFLFNTHPEYVRNRRLEMDLLQKTNLLLASIPFDTNSFRLPRFQAKKSKTCASWHVALTDRLAGHLRRWYWLRWRKEEPRRYYRLYDLNRPPWQAVRSAAEGCRARAEGILALPALQDVLPPCSVPFNHGKPFTGGTLCRNLLGFLFWLEQYPQDP